MRQRIIGRASLALLGCLWLVAPATVWSQGGAAAVDKEALRGLDIARQAVRQAQQTVQQRRVEEAGKRQLADNADQALLESSAGDVTRLTQLAQSAKAARQDLAAAMAAMRLADERLEQTRDQLRAVAAGLADCGTGRRCPAAELAAASVPGARSISDEQWLQIGNVAESGLKAQALVSSIKGRVPKAFELGDGAVARAAEAASSAASQRPEQSEHAKCRALRGITHQGKPEDCFEPIVNARTAFAGAFGVYVDARGVQDKANDLVRLSLVLAECLRDRTDPCPAVADGRFDRAKALLTELQATDAETKRALGDVRFAADQAAIGLDYPSPEDRLRVARFKRLIAENKDASSLFGGDAYRLSAGVKGAQATIRLDLDRLPSDLTRDSSLTFASPAATEGKTRLYNTADGLANAFNATYARRWFLPIADNRVLPDVLAYGWSLSAGYQRFAYRDDADLTKADELTASRMPWSLGLQVASASADARRWHQLGISIGNAYKATDESIRCPAGASANSLSAACVQASFGAPSRKLTRTLTYVNRYQPKTGAWPIAPSFKYEQVSSVKEFELPIYLIAGDDSDRSMTGGLSIQRTSRARGSDAPSRWTFGIFVGGPFKLFDGLGP